MQCRPAALCAGWRNGLRAMTSSRHLLIRGSVTLNAFFVLYLCTTWFSDTTDIAVVQDTQSQHLRSLEELANGSRYLLENKSLDWRQTPSDGGDSDVPQPDGPPPLCVNCDEKKDDASAADTKQSSGSKEGVDANTKGSPKQTPSVPAAPLGSDDSHLAEPPREVQESMGVTEHLVAADLASDAPDPSGDSLEKKMYPDLRDCPTRQQVPFHSQRGMYWVLENYISAALSFRCDESVTYTTHGDYTFLDNLETLTSRWQGPVSIGVYAPGTDFEATVNTILHLRDCWAEGIKKFVTFHLIYHTDHMPNKIPSTEELLQRKADCNVDPPSWVNVTTYRQAKQLVYPINVARNVARRSASTYFVFPSDIELYPSVHFIPEFFKMLKKPDVSSTTLPKVFVFSIFEVKSTVSPPESKPELLKMLSTGDAIPFHKNMCAKCHNIPHSKEWLTSPANSGLSTIHVGKRLGAFKKWEPIYVGTHREPLYDERLSWEGMSDKMTQMYILCVRDYEFLILDSAFLVHKPGIKNYKKDPTRTKIVAAQNALIKKRILPEYQILYGNKTECIM